MTYKGCCGSNAGYSRGSAMPAGCSGSAKGYANATRGDYAANPNPHASAGYGRPSGGYALPLNFKSAYQKMGEVIDESDRRIRAEIEAHLKQALMNSEQSAIFSPDDFVSKRTRFVGKAEEILSYIQEAYEKTTGNSLPEDFSLSVCSKEELIQAHRFFNGSWSNGIQGFCINREHQGMSRVFVKEGELAKVMLTIGHELGHIQTASVHGVEEEAKAFAFSIAWMNTIRTHDIAGLANVIIAECPAENGLHNVAFDFVVKKLRQGFSAMDVFSNLINGLKVETYLYSSS